MAGESRRFDSALRFPREPGLAHPHQGGKPVSEFREVLAALFSAPKLLRLMTGSPAEAIEGVLAQVREEHESVEAFLLANGATQDNLDSLRTNLINKAYADEAN